jgi:1,4-alpha-glucan branching enzyme
MGAHPHPDGGYYFRVWAPNADEVSVVGDFNGWKTETHRLHKQWDTGIWEGYVSEATVGHCYKYSILHEKKTFEKADPYALFSECSPKTASVLYESSYKWRDDVWLKSRAFQQALDSPISIYEVHLGSWKRGPNNEFLNYRQIAPKLVEHVKELGFTHVELLPVMEHPFYGSWGYQVTGFFAPTVRMGTPDDFRYLVDSLHRAGIGVILDWVPAHFPTDKHGLYRFDGTALFEHEDPRKGFHPDWNTAIFNYGRDEVASFLLSSALYWLREFHIDALRVDAVSSMLYLDYSRGEGEWIPNEEGGRENLEAIAFLRRLNSIAYAECPGIQMIAEESTAWPKVSWPIESGGLGFGLKWDMGWMHDTLAYFQRDPIYRQHHHNQLTFRPLYAYTENFVLSLSHDEVVHLKGSLLGKMPGDRWQQLANERLLMAYQWATPGKKLLFMGMEMGQEAEWNHDQSLDWWWWDNPIHRGLGHLLSRLNELYRAFPALHEKDCQPEGFQWVSCDDAAHSVLGFLRRSRDEKQTVLCLFNFTPVPREYYRLGVPSEGDWMVLLNTDQSVYGGSELSVPPRVRTESIPWQGFGQSLTITLPPLGALFLCRAEGVEKGASA